VDQEECADEHLVALQQELDQLTVMMDRAKQNNTMVRARVLVCVCANVCKCVQMCANVCKCVQMCASVCMRTMRSQGCCLHTCGPLRAPQRRPLDRASRICFQPVGLKGRAVPCCGPYAAAHAAAPLAALLVVDRAGRLLAAPVQEALAGWKISSYTQLHVLRKQLLPYLGEYTWLVL